MSELQPREEPISLPRATLAMVTYELSNNFGTYEDFS